MLSPGSKRYTELPDQRPAYQRHKYLQALKHVPHKKVFVDVGAHCGLWSMQAELDFDQIIAFEPHPEHAKIYRENVKGRYELHEFALGAEEGSVSLAGMEGSSGDTHVSGPGDIPMRKMDDFGIFRIDLLKIDVEGFELPVVQGAKQTILNTRPVIVLEQKGRDDMYFQQEAQGALTFLKKLGMCEIDRAISGDYFLGWL